jgi:hypothetical protein
MDARGKKQRQRAEFLYDEIVRFLGQHCYLILGRRDGKNPVDYRITGYGREPYWDALHGHEAERNPSEKETRLNAMIGVNRLVPPQLFERKTGEIAKHLGISDTAARVHLKFLKDNGLLVQPRFGVWTLRRDNS